MPTFSVTVAGLIAFVVKKNGNGVPVEAAAVLVKHDKHEHFPILLIPKDCISDDEAVKSLILKDPSPLLKKADLPRDVSDYVAYDVKGYNLDLKTAPQSAGLTLDSGQGLPSSGCPENGDWSSLEWLLNLNEVNHKPKIRFKKHGLRKSSAAVNAFLGVGHGRLSGHAPVEISEKIRKLSYEKETPRAYTDAASWSTVLVNDAQIDFMRRKDETLLGTLKLKNDVDAMLLNLPDPNMTGTPGGHVDAFRSLPFDDDTKVGNLAANGDCGTGRGGFGRETSGSSTLTVTVTVDGAPPSEVSVSATARYGYTETSGTPESHVHGTTSGLESRGDSLCMGLVIDVEDI